jgi:Ser/Thr protein kinase RdoA (MazF antagonist)
MRFLIANSPTFPVDLAARLAEDTFGISGTLSALYSERDQNFRVAGGVSGDFVLKISNAVEDPDLVAAQIAALEFLARTAPDLPLPRVRRTLAGAAQIDLPGEGDAQHATFALSYLPGQIASDAMLFADEFHAIGRMIARVERGMRGFFHPALGDRALLWDIRQLGQLRDKCRHLGPNATRIRDLLDEVTEALSGRLEGLAAHVIHGDIHGHNLILGPDRAISGIIDFGDMFHGPVILNLTNALADFQHENEQTQATWTALIRGYASIRRIEPEELALLYHLTLARHLVTILITATRACEAADQSDYIGAAGAWPRQSDRTFRRCRRSCRPVRRSGHRHHDGAAGQGDGLAPLRLLRSAPASGARRRGLAV